MNENNGAVTISLDEKVIKELDGWADYARRNVAPGHFHRALAQAVNRTLDSSKTRAIKEVVERYTAKRADVTKTISVKKVPLTSSAELNGELRFTGKRISALSFKNVKPKTPQSQKGIPVKLRPGVYINFLIGGGGQRKEMAVINLGQEPQIYSRIAPDGTRRKGKYKLFKQTGPAAPQMVGNAEIVASVQGHANEILLNRIDHEMRRLLSRI